MPQKKVVNSFNAGELSPYLYARTDFSKYSSGCLTMENFIPLPYGGAVRRPPFEFLGAAMDTDADGNSDAVRIIPFLSSTTDAYQIEFGDEKLRFWKDGARINESEVSIVESGTYEWAESGSGTNEYYLQASGGGDPVIQIPNEVVGTQTDFKFNATLGSLLTNQWGYGDNDTLGYNTIYVRLFVGTDPEDLDDDAIIANYIYEIDSPYSE